MVLPLMDKIMMRLVWELEDEADEIEGRIDLFFVGRFITNKSSTILP